MLNEPMNFLELQDFIGLFWRFWVILSLGLSIDVLLRKTDSRSSLLWLVILWLAPYIGAFLYMVFGINRVSNRAARLDFHDMRGAPDETRGLASHWKRWGAQMVLGRRVSGSELMAGNTIELISGNDDIHAKIISDINEATDNLVLATYIFRKDELGIAVADALVSAMDRGVDVRVLLDGFGNSVYRSGIYRYLRNRGVNTRRFLHSIWPWRMPYLNLRNHRKILVIDNKIAFTGSGNIGEVDNIETHYRMTGPITEQLHDQFELDWALDQKSPAELKTRTTKPPVIDNGQILRVIPSGPAFKRENLRWVILGALGSAKTNIRIVTPYFVPDRGLIAGLILAAYRGVKVELILPEKSNYFFVDWASRRQLKELARAGCKIYMRPDRFDHSKIMTIDGSWALIGSSNWDARSMRLNFEMDVECYDKAFCASLNELIDARRHKAVPLAAGYYEKRSPLLKIRDSVARLALPYL